jgi:hypothetical protein
MPAFAPAALAEITADMDPALACELLGVKVEDVLAELNYRRERKRALMRRRMALAAKAGGERRILKGDVGGYTDMMIDPVSYHYWGNRLGYACWDDPQFVAEYKRDNPECRVKLRGTPGLETLAMARNRAQPRTPDPRSRTPARRVTGRRGRWAA